MRFICSNTNFKFVSAFNGVKILIADDFILNGKSTYFISVVKSSNIIQSPLL